MAKLKIGNRYVDNLKFGDMKFKFYVADNKEINFKLLRDYEYIGKINWGDGETTYINTTPTEDEYITHTYSTAGYKTVILITNNWYSIDFSANNSHASNVYQKIREVISWGKNNNLLFIDFTKSSLEKIPNEIHALNISKNDLDIAFKGVENIDYENLSNL